MFDIGAQFEAALSTGNWWLALPLIYLAGLATALTPCVYPMIVITVSVFGARQAKSRMEGAVLSTSYVLGMCALFTVLGLVSATGGGFFGEWLNHPVVLLGFASLFFALALAMFGLYELNLPPGLQNRLAQVGGIGVQGAFVLGAAMSLIAAPCTGPALLVLLAWIGTSGNLALGGTAMFVYGLGLGTLFWIVGTFAIVLPKSGQWMEMVKSVFGIAMCAMALYWLRSFGLQELVGGTTLVLIASTALLIVGLALGAVHLSYYDPRTTTRARKTTGIAFSALGTFGLVMWLGASPRGATAEGGALAWREDFQTALADARANHRPYIVDFGASWCQACGELERHTFADPRVVDEGGRFVAVRVDLSPGQDTQEKRELLRTYAQRGLPLVVLHDSAGQEVHRVTTFVDADVLVEMMRSVD